MKVPPGRSFPASARDAVSQEARKYSTSPLVDPIVSSLVLVWPEQSGRSRGPTDLRGNYQRKTHTLVAAAQILAVPTFLCYWGKQPPSPSLMHGAFACDAYDCIWKNEVFLKALDAVDRSALVIAGYWLDRELLTAALYALADCYDVYVPLDATPAQSKVAARLTEARLTLAGAIPLLTDQLLHEWVIETPHVEHKAALTALVRG